MSKNYDRICTTFARARMRKIRALNGTINVSSQRYFRARSNVARARARCPDEPCIMTRPRVQYVQLEAPEGRENSLVSAPKNLKRGKREREREAKRRNCDCGRCFARARARMLTERLRIRFDKTASRSRRCRALKAERTEIRAIPRKVGSRKFNAREIGIIMSTHTYTHTHTHEYGRAHAHLQQPPTVVTIGDSPG